MSREVYILVHRHGSSDTGLYNTHGTTHIVVAHIGVHAWEYRHRTTCIGLLRIGLTDIGLHI